MMAELLLEVVKCQVHISGRPQQCFNQESVTKTACLSLDGRNIIVLSYHALHVSLTEHDSTAVILAVSSRSKPSLVSKQNLASH